jgi:hypothetical protein
MVMARKEVAVDFITRLKDKGFKDLDKNTKKSVKSLQKFGKALGVALTTTALVTFVKKSTQQFAELEKSTRRLESELNTLGIAFATSLATDFTRSLALATGTSQDKLIPSLQKLVATTYTLTDAQKLLGLAVEISGRKGLELEQVTNALSRAFVGDYNALVRLRIGFEKADVEGKTFAELLARLQGEFGTRQADTFADKLEKIKVGFEEAQVALGKGFIQGLEDSGVSVEEFQSKMIALGTTIGEALGKAVGYFEGFQNKLDELAKNPVIKLLLTGLDALIGLDPIMGTGRDTAAKENAARKRQALAYEKELSDRNKLLKLSEAEALLAKQRAAELKRLQAKEKAAAAEKKRSADLEKLRNSIQFKFDIDAINLQAALRRQLSQTDRDRVLQLSALKISDYQTDEEAIKTLKAATEGRYDDAMNLEKVLQLLKTAGFAADKASIDALAALKPNIKFTDNLDDIKNALKALIEGKYTINIGATITMPAIPGITNGGASTFDPGRFRKKDEDRSIDLEPGKPPVVRPPYIDLPGEQAGEPFKRPFVPDLGSFRFFEENEDSSLRNLYDKTSVPSNFDVSSSRYFEETGRSARGMATPSFFDPAGFRARDEGVTINVNVQGSVVAQNDLVAAVTDAVYATQRTGNNILLEGI